MAVDLTKLTAEIDVTQNQLVVVSDGKVTILNGPTSGHGEYACIWKDGKVLDVIKSERVRVK
ncbi:hypothetical protein AB990_03855 [Alkalihalobacillus pseudalcaliphilus]|nr:hypothetical protein AB990_03855 [Alkalihalobacillus pseudalcaliphilus]